MSRPRVFLCGITSAGNEANLRALVEPVNEHLDGLQFTFHYPTDAGADYLESRKGAGRVVYAHFGQRHGYSMTHYLWQGTMQDGDYFLQLDSAERVSTAFMTDKLPGFIDLMEETRVAMVANYGKGFLFRFNEQLEFRGSPHWYATKLDGNGINVELEKRHFWNVRHEQRGEFQWVTHYLGYMLYPAGSNHALLGLDTYGNPQELFGPREEKRLAFRREMRRRGFALTVDGFKAMCSDPAQMDVTLKGLLAGDKVWSDAYHHLVCGRTDVIHSHRPADALPIP